MDQEEKRGALPEELAQARATGKDPIDQASAQTGVPAAEVFGVDTFFDLLGGSDAKVRVCTGLSCRLEGADELLARCHETGLESTESSCLAACDRAPAVLRDRRTLVDVTPKDIERSHGDWTRLDSGEAPSTERWIGYVWPEEDSSATCALNLGGEPDWSGKTFARADEMGAEAVIEALDQAGLQGRGGAGFPAALKWRSVREQTEARRFVVLNADEAEPGTFKDREVMMHRPDLVLEGLAIAAHVVGARDIYLYVRGEFEVPWEVLKHAIAQVERTDIFGDLRFHMHSGHGAYICGEETALLESLEGRRGQPREKPPYPTEVGLWGKPTLIQNVETIACVPAILQRGGEWFRGLGRTAPGTKLYCLSGHVARPGVYEMPLGVSLDELVEAAGGYIGKLKAFSPGGASSGFLPASERGRALDFKSLGEAGSMLGSAGVVVLNESVDMAWAAREQLSFFERESCGQCAPCRIGTAYQRDSMDRYLEGRAKAAGPAALDRAGSIALEMREGSICGLGQTASLPLESAMKYFPQDFE